MYVFLSPFTMRHTHSQRDRKEEKWTEIKNIRRHKLKEMCKKSNEM